MSTGAFGNRTQPRAMRTTEYPRDSSLPELVDRQAAARPEAHAAESSGRVLTYGALRSRSDELAGRLLAADVRRGDFVGLCGTRSPEALVAMLGILKAGAAYVPLDDTYPPARLRAMAEDTHIRVAVVLPGGTCRIRRLRTRIDLPSIGGNDTGIRTRQSIVDAKDCAYVTFTSGSTGRPKPVAVPHRGVVRLVADPSLSPPRPDDRVLHALSLSSDGSTHEIWSALLTGACLVLVDREDLLAPAVLEERLRAGGVTFAHLTTSVFHHMARTRPGGLSGLRFVSAGGEALDPDLVRAVREACPGTEIVNFYGPTENSVVSTAHVIGAPDSSSVPIGRPIANSTAYVVRDDGTLADTGEEGELWVGGDGIAQGYPGYPELTRERFVPDPFRPGERVYRTGDRARWREDDVLEYLGRRDRQLKVRGHRIELDEIETRLRAHSSVGEAAVEVSADGDGALVAYVTPARGGDDVALSDVRRDLAMWLPRQAIPSRFVQLAQFPLTTSGKIDRARLAENDVPWEDVDEPRGDELRDEVAAIWRRTLRVSPSDEDGFFELGGDSMLAAEVVTRTVASLDLDPRRASALVRSLLNDPTLAGFTGSVHAMRDRRGPAASEPRIDYEAESALGFPLPGPWGPPPRWERPEHVLLTGASGFVGAHLLERLLETTGATVHCPVRARDETHARQRVLANLTRYGLQPAGTEDRLVCFPADLAASGLGLTARHHAELAQTVDLIVHSAAEVNFLYPYHALRASNVEATRSIVRLAAPRRVPVHFLSTIGVVAGFGTAGVRHVDEDTPLAYAERISMGYAETKWVAERILDDAADQGLPVAIYRPYEVTGDQVRGICNTDTAICSLFKVFTETGTAPDVPLPMDFVPVDYVVSTILRIATERRATRTVYHLTNPHPATLNDMVGRMRAAGCRIEPRTYEQWVDDLVCHVAQHPTSPAAPFVSLCTDRANAATVSIKEMYFTGTFPEIGRGNVTRALPDGGPPCPPVDAALLDRYLRYFFASGYLTRPAASESGSR